MGETIIEQIERLLERNHSLLKMAEGEEWENFTPEVEAYSQQLNALSVVDFSPLDAEVRAIVVMRLEALLAQDAALMTFIRERLNDLSAEMSTIRKSRSSAHAYTAV